MSAPSGRRIPPVAWEILLATLLVLARVWIYGLRFVLTDWFSILCAFWIFTAVGSRTRAWPVVAAVLMAGLLLSYGWHQAPAAWAALGFGR